MAQTNAIVVVNAGSSSIKFSLFGENGGDLSVFLKGQIEGLYTDGTHFTAREVGSGPVADERWDGAAGTHDGAMRRLLDFVRTHLGGHRVDEDRQARVGVPRRSARLPHRRVAARARHRGGLVAG